MVKVIDLSNLDEMTEAFSPVQPVSPNAASVAPPNDIPLVESPVYRTRDLPWDGISTPVRGITHIDDALAHAGLNWKVIQEPVFRKDGTLIKNRVANIREDTNDFIEIVSNRYKPFQNSQAMAFLEGIVSTGALELESAGHFGYDSIFIEAKTPRNIRVVGEDFYPFVLIKNSHDGSSGVKVCFTYTRVVCRNTLTMALRNAPRIWQAKHLGTIEDRMEEAKNMLYNLEQYSNEYPVMAEKLHAINITTDEVTTVLQKMFPVKEDAGVRAINTVKAAVQEIMTIYTRTPDLAPHRDTALGFLYAVGDYTTHHTPKETAGWRENRLARIADGHPLLNVAQAALLEIPA